MFSNIEKNMEVGLAAIPPWLKELSYASDTMSDRHSEGNLHLKNKLQNYVIHFSSNHNFNKEPFRKQHSYYLLLSSYWSLFPHMYV